MIFKPNGRIIRGTAPLPLPSPHPLPPIHARVVNFAKASVREGLHKIFGRPARTEEEKKRFHDTCKACPGKYYDAPTDTCHHPKCGCPMGRKSRWNSTYCPGGYVKFE